MNDKMIQIRSFSSFARSAIFEYKYLGLLCFVERKGPLNSRIVLENLHYYMLEHLQKSEVFNITRT